MYNSILDYFEKTCERLPQKIAFADKEKNISFSKLHDIAKAIGTRIARGGVVKRPVLVLSGKNAFVPAMIMGVVYSGNFYIPIDAETPEARLIMMIQEISPIAIIGMKENVEKLKNINVPIIAYEDASETETNEVCLKKIRNNIIETDPLYAISTSGSTGKPKIVLKSHRSIICFINNYLSIFGISENDNLGNQTPFYFDASTKDFYSTVFCGATTYIIPKEYFSLPVKLIEYINDMNITLLVWVPSALIMVSALKTFEKIKPKHLRIVLFVGEVMPIKHLRIWKDALPNVLFVNLYGVTEVSGNCLYYKVTDEFDEYDTLPMGIPFPGCEIMLVNEQGKLSADGEPGEIYIRSSTVAIGYYNDPDRTKNVFVQNPLISSYNDIVYKTGDIAIIRRNGKMFYISRQDYQIKHMGHRIELGEIECTVQNIDKIIRCCCIYDNIKNRIILFYQADEMCNQYILEKLSAFLPRYMLPNKVIFVSSFPLNANSKIDREKLKDNYFNDSYKQL